MSQLLYWSSWDREPEEDSLLCSPFECCAIVNGRLCSSWNSRWWDFSSGWVHFYWHSTITTQIQILGKNYERFHSSVNVCSKQCNGRMQCMQLSICPVTMVTTVRGISVILGWLLQSAVQTPVQICEKTRSFLLGSRADFSTCFIFPSYYTTLWGAQNKFTTAKNYDGVTIAGNGIVSWVSILLHRQ